MPPIGWLVGGVDFKDLSLQLPQIWNNADDAAPVLWKYGNFIQVVIDFLIVAFCVFLLIKV